MDNKEERLNGLKKRRNRSEVPRVGDTGGNAKERQKRKIYRPANNWIESRQRNDGFSHIYMLDKINQIKKKKKDQLYTIDVYNLNV